MIISHVDLHMANLHMIISHVDLHMANAASSLMRLDATSRMRRAHVRRVASRMSEVHIQATVALSESVPPRT